MTLEKHAAANRNLAVDRGRTRNGSSRRARARALCLCAAAAGDAPGLELDLCQCRRNEHRKCGRISGRRADRGAGGAALRRQANISRRHRCDRARHRRIGPDFTILGSDELAGVGGPVGRVGVCGGRLDDSSRQQLGRAGATCARNLLCGRRTGRGHVCRRRAVVARHGGVAGRLAGARRPGPGRQLDRVARAAARAVARGTICDGERVDVVAAAR